MEQWQTYFPPLNLWNYSVSWSWSIDPELESFYDGPDRFRHGEIAKEATGECETPQDWDFLVEETKLVNAKASTGEVTVSGKNVKFSARTVKAKSFAV